MSTGVVFLLLILIPQAHALTLSEAESALVSANREIAAARRAVDRAQADTLSAAARPNPNLSLALSDMSPSRGFNGGSGVTQALSLDQLIERGDKRGLRVKTADQLLSASRADLAETIRNQRLGLAQAYWDLKLAESRLAIGEQSAALFRESVHTAELRVKAGDLAAADLARLKVDALRAEADARQAAADRTRAQWALAALLAAENTATQLGATDPWPELLPLPPAAETDLLLAQRADVRAAQNRLAAADNLRQLAARLKTRDVTLTGSVEQNVDSPHGRFGVGVSMPLFVNYGYEGEIARAEADYGRAQDELARVRARAEAEIAQARSDLESARTRLERYRNELVPAAEESQRAVEYGYSRGAQPLTDLLDARRNARALQLETATAEATHAKALAAWKAATAQEISQ